jgi:hypothetical protein
MAATIPIIPFRLAETAEWRKGREGGRQCKCNSVEREVGVAGESSVTSTLKSTSDSIGGLFHVRFFWTQPIFTVNPL